MEGILSSLGGLRERDDAPTDVSTYEKASTTEDQKPELHTAPASEGDDDVDVKVETAMKRHVTPAMIRQVGTGMLEEHHVPDSFRDAIMSRILAAEFDIVSAGEDLLSDEDWSSIRSAELRLLFLVAIKSSMSLGVCFNFTASSEYGFISPLLKQAQFINAGSPFVNKGNASHTMDYERKLVLMCADLFGAVPDDVDGYVATGSSESNAVAVRWAGEAFPNAPFIGGENMHFSIKRAVKVVGRELLEVEAAKSGEMDMDALGRVLQGCKERGVSAVCVMLVCGMTMGEGHDNIDEAIAQLDAAGYDHEHRYIHVDSAYSGFVLPFLEDVDPGVRVDFRRQGLSSCSASLQKALGVSAPASVFLISKNFARATFYEYIQTTDITLSCSRNGYSAFEGWAMLTYILGTGREGWSSRWRQAVSMAVEFAAKLEEAGVADVTYNRSSVTVLFPEPSNLLAVRYSLQRCNGRAQVMFNFHNLDGAASGLFLKEYLEWYAQRD